MVEFYTDERSLLANVAVEVKQPIEKPL